MNENIDDAAGLTLWQPSQAARDDSGYDPTGNSHLARNVVRPCMFHTERVSGLLVNELSPFTDGLETQWFLYLQLSDGQRGRAALTPALPVPRDAPITFKPLPDFLPLDEPHRWSPRGRAAFANGYVPDLSKLYGRLRDAFVDHLEFPGGDDGEGEIAALVLWTVLTYAYPAWRVVPYIAIGGHWGSGKTVVLCILNCLVFNPVMSVSASPSFVFRMLNESGGTLLLDETERLGSKNIGATEFHRILNAGYKAGGYVHRVEAVKGKRRPASFNVFGPKAIAGIAGLTSTLESRCIRLTMSRAAEDSPAARRRLEEDVARWTELRDDLYSFALEHGADMVNLARRTDLCSFGNRDFELWHPLFALAHFFEEAGVEGLVSTVTGFADFVRESKENRRASQADEVLLRQLAVHVRANNQRRITAQDLLQAAARVLPERFAGWTPKRVSNTLLGYGLKAAKSNGRRVYARVGEADLARIQRLYDLDLGGIWTAPTDPSGPGSEEGPGRP